MSLRIVVLPLLALGAGLLTCAAPAAGVSATALPGAGEGATQAVQSVIALVTPAKLIGDDAKVATLHVLLPDGEAAAVTMAGPPGARATDRWTLPQTAPGTIQTVTWKATGRRPASGGRYTFRVTPMTTVVGVRLQAGAPVDASFEVAGGVFPILGPHTYNMGEGRFGNQRAGHRHAGQDTFAKCGTPLVAARGGTVRERKYEGAAGNYLVVDVDGTEQADVYDHLKDPATAKKGQHLAAGDPIGHVGQSGDAQGCHLHFEMWTAPGWFVAGAHPHDPLPYLKQWDAEQPGGSTAVRGIRGLK